jgi:intracellular sulfur oxidation DsrE/DsrF family protein
MSRFSFPRNFQTAEAKKQYYSLTYTTNFKKMRKLSVALMLVLFTFAANAQQNKLSVVWDLNNADTAVQGAVFRQINNARAVKPNLEVEVVFHGYAIKSLLKDNKSFEARVKAAKEKGVIIAVCNNSLKRLKINPTELMPEVTVVPSAVAELIVKQSEGWSYIKAGN